VNGRATFARIDLAALAANLTAIKAWVGGRPVLAVVKADAYGHGAQLVAQTLAAAGADAFGVATLDEALELRAAGIEHPVVLLGVLPARAAAEAVAAGIEVAAYDRGQVEALAQAARAQRRVARVHVKIDTGMARLGVVPQDVAGMLVGLAGVEVVGLFTTLALGADPKGSAGPLGKLAEAAAALTRAGFSGFKVHAANSAAISLNREAFLDLVRPGLLLYGVRPEPEVGPAVTPVLSLTTEVVQVREFAEGLPVGYGGTFVSRRPSRLATIAMGYADGLRRSLSNRAELLVRGRRAPLVGNISMDLAVLDVTAVAGVAVGDVVTVVGKDGVESLGAAELAAIAGTIPWEILTGIGRRVPRLASQGAR